MYFSPIFMVALQPSEGYDLLIHEVFLDHTQRRTTVGGLLWTSDQLVAETST